MESYSVEITKAIQEQPPQLWKFIRIAEGIWIGIAKKNFFHEHVYKRALHNLPDTHKDSEEWAKRVLFGKPIDAGYILFCNGVLYVCEGSTGYGIKGDTDQRSETAEQVQHDIPEIEVKTKIDTRAVYDLFEQLSERI